jgi:MFS family permease
MLGLFIILPVFVLYARELPGGNNQVLIGIALGAYGLAQACFQLLFGRLSDRWGRKRAIYLGLLIFAFGSLVAAIAGNIYLVAVGRAIQGAGAISAALIALTADLTRDDNRTKSMAIIGMTIGATFIVSMVAGPVLSGIFGVPGIFALTGVLALAAMLVVRFIVPDPPASPSGGRVQTPGTVMDVLRDRQLARLNFGIFALHGVLMAMFVVVPVELVDQLAQSEHWKMYLGDHAACHAGIRTAWPAESRFCWQYCGDRRIGFVVGGRLRRVSVNGWRAGPVFCSIQLAGGDVAVVGI